MVKEKDESLRNIKAVFFDYDDTLVNSLEAKWAHHKHVAKVHYGKTLTDEEIRKHWTNPFSQLVGLLYSDNDLERAMKNNLAHEDAFPKMLLDDTIYYLRAPSQ